MFFRGYWKRFLLETDSKVHQPVVLFHRYQRYHLALVAYPISSRKWRCFSFPVSSLLCKYMDCTYIHYHTYMRLLAKLGDKELRWSLAQTWNEEGNCCQRGTLNQLFGVCPKSFTCFHVIHVHAYCTRIFIKLFMYCTSTIQYMGRFCTMFEDS